MLADAAAAMLADAPRSTATGAKTASDETMLEPATLPVLPQATDTPAAGESSEKAVGQVVSLLLPPRGLLIFDQVWEPGHSRLGTNFGRLPSFRIGAWLM